MKDAKKSGTASKEQKNTYRSQKIADRQPSWLAIQETKDSSPVRGAPLSADGLLVEMDQQLITFLREASRILVFTGAGISSLSGIPDQKGLQGIWDKEPIYYQDFLISEKARIAYWESRLENWEIFQVARPNAVHRSIVSLERAQKLELVVTQNIDGLHSWAGTSPSRLVELYGTTAEMECQKCHLRSTPQRHYDYFRRYRQPPLCDSCGGLIMSSTISFGQGLRRRDLERAGRAAAAADLVIVLGSRLNLYPAASIPLLAAQKGAPYLIINREKTEHDDHPLVSLRMFGNAMELFPQAVDVICAGHDDSKAHTDRQSTG